MLVTWAYRLGELTRSHHAVADAQRIALMEVASVESYVTFLERIWSFESAIELRAAGIPVLSRATAGASARMARLRGDLRTLGRSSDQIAGLPHAALDIERPMDLLGWLYVCERHVLLAGLVARVLASRLGPALEGACEYLTTHAPCGGEQFRRLGAAIDSHIHADDTKPAHVLAATRRAFEVQQAWYTRRAHARVARVAA